MIFWIDSIMFWAIGEFSVYFDQTLVYSEYTLSEYSSMLGLHWEHTSKSRLAVDREFMYIGSAGPGRADGRTDGRTEGGRADGGRTGGRTGGRRGVLKRKYRFLQLNWKTCPKNIKSHSVFWLFESRGSISTDFYSLNEKCVQKRSKKT